MSQKDACETFLDLCLLQETLPEPYQNLMLKEYALLNLMVDHHAPCLPKQKPLVTVAGGFNVWL